MFGYMEDDFTVLKKIEHQGKTTKHIYELREKIKSDNQFFTPERMEALKITNINRYNEILFTQKVEMKPYIAVIVLDQNNKVKNDLLFFYFSHNVGEFDQNLIDLTNDWEKISNVKIKNIEDLKYHSRIDSHHIGYTKDGGVIMY